MQQNNQVANEQTLDSGLMCLVTAARLLGIPADYQQLKRAFVVSDGMADTVTLLRASKDLKLKAKKTRTQIEKLPKLALPVMVQLENGQYVVIVKADDQRVLVFDPYKQRPLTLTHGELAADWNGQVILLVRRFSVASLEQEFNFSWFIAVVARFKRPFAEVLVASFFLQSFGLVTPLFSQVIIDKVLVHKGVSTLDILALGLLFGELSI